MWTEGDGTGSGGRRASSVILVAGWRLHFWGRNVSMKLWLILGSETQISVNNLIQRKNGNCCDQFQTEEYQLHVSNFGAISSLTLSLHSIGIRACGDGIGIPFWFWCHWKKLVRTHQQSNSSKNMYENHPQVWRLDLASSHLETMTSWIGYKSCRVWYYSY
jgi:hypothetical protein